MRITIITPTYNSAVLLPTTLRSVQKQTFPEVEHIVVDGYSTDGTAELLRQEHAGPWISEPDSGIYDALNKGLELASGTVIGVLGAGDFFSGPDALATLVQPLFSSTVSAVYSDVAFVRPENADRIVRYYSSADFRPGMFINGFMPAHPTFYARLQVLRQLGGYKSHYRICGDYELLLRFLLIHGFPSRYVPGLPVVMRTGGVSNDTFLSRLHLNQEMVRACRENGIHASLAQMAWKYPIKFKEFLGPALRRSAPRFNTLDSAWME